ncbi:MAG: YIP1 family protein [Aestuariivita sp.]|uniref:YIP1 family protein n=1 Tax=Aestuariivita sp. TaxID=1872407 RepID=UPI003BB18730
MIQMPSLKDLALLSVQNPAEAARLLISLRIDRKTLWTGLFLVAVLNTLLNGLNTLLVPGPSPFPGLFDVPAVYFFFISGGLVLTVITLYWVGRSFGGQASMEDVIVVVVWLQFLRVLVQAAALLLLLTIPMLSIILVFAAALVGLWILVHFVDQAHQFQSPVKAAGVLIAAFVGMVVGLSILLSLIGGVGAMGV